MKKNSKIYVAGHTGLVGTALLYKLRAKGYGNIVTRSREELNLLDQNAVSQFFKVERPDFVFLSAGKTGGIYANNTYRADFIHENITIQNNIIHQSFMHEVAKLMYFSCSCIYPKHAPQPMREEHILTGAVEPTNEPFAIAKIAGLKMCESYNRQYGTDFIPVIPTNIYGPQQKYELMNSQVLPSLILKFHKAKELGQEEVILWGTGRPARDLLYVDDLAEASIYLMKNYQDNEPINIGSGKDYTIVEMAEIIKREVGYKGEIIFDPSLPDGVLKKLQDITRIRRLGWKPIVSLVEGVHLTYESFKARLIKGEIIMV
jgi:GDP-L-fucose synthase